MTDPIVEKNVALLRARSAVGVAKYGTTLERDDLALIDWLRHALEEVLDQANYLQAAITRIEGDRHALEVKLAEAMLADAARHA
jgi:hypothetical protein